jgi:hypothetical protein
MQVLRQLTVICVVAVYGASTLMSYVTSAFMEVSCS